MKARFIDWSPLRPPVQWWPTSMTVTPLDDCHAPIPTSAVTLPLRGRCEHEREGDTLLSPVRCQRHTSHPGAHWAYGRGTWTSDPTPTESNERLPQ